MVAEFFSAYKKFALYPYRQESTHLSETAVVHRSDQKVGLKEGKQNLSLFSLGQCGGMR